MLLKVIKILIFLVVAKRLAELIFLMGFHKTPSNHWPGPCRAIPLVEHGAEDMVLTKDGLAIITSGIDTFYRGDLTDPRVSNAEGKLFAVDLNNPGKNATELKLGIDFDFVPHGISIWEARGGETRLFVVNHREEAETIEIFKLTGSVAKPSVEHVKSVQDSLFTSMNDIVATGPDSFYVSNDGYLRYTLWRSLERLFHLPWGSVVYYDGKEVRPVIGSAFEPNGMDISKGGKFVYISIPFSSAIFVYARSLESNELTLLHKIQLNVIADNIFVHPETGDLWYGATTIAYRVFASFASFDEVAPSMAGRVRSLSSKDHPFEEYKIYDVYLDDGNLMSGSSSAVVHGNNLLIGSIIQKLVYCEMKTETTLPRERY